MSDERGTGGGEMALPCTPGKMSKSEATNVVVVGRGFFFCISPDIILF